MRRLSLRIMFAIGLLLRRVEKGRPARGSAADTEVFLLASSSVESGGRLGCAEHERLNQLRFQFERLRKASAWPNADELNFRRAHDSLWVLHLIADASRSEASDRAG